MTALDPDASSATRDPIAVGGPYAPVAHPRFSSRAAALIVLSFLPYAAIPVGENSNLPLASLAAALYVRELVARPRLLAMVLVVGCTPLVFLYFQSLIGHGHGNVRNIVSWFAFLAPFAGAACAVASSFATVLLTLRLMLVASAAYTLAQLYFFDRGSIPFVAWYEMPGYFSVPENAEVIVMWIRRPFGWFPEPSFMAGTLALGSIALLLLGIAARRQVRTIDLGIVALAVAAMFVGRSGSSLVVAPALAALALLPFSSKRRKLAFAALGLGGSLALGWRLIAARNGIANSSWDDRGTSIIAGMRHVLESPQNLLLGVGRGGATVLYTQGAVSTEGLPLSTPLADIFSVSGRVVMENGVIGGGLILLVLLVPLLRAPTLLVSWPFGVVAAAAWLTVITLTITYDSAVWLWMLPGVCVGLLEVVGSVRHDAGQPARQRLLSRGHDAIGTQGSSRPGPHTPRGPAVIGPGQRGNNSDHP